MTVFLTPDGKPFYGGTYFPKPNFQSLMAAIEDVWTNRQEDVTQNVTALMEALSRQAALAPADGLPGVESIEGALQQLSSTFDVEWGGFGAPPKFPSTMNLDLMLRVQRREPSEAARSIIRTSLNAMASGGMYDHIGGGFARYSTDREWLVPHFEKMLYDQALLVRIYLHGWLVLGEPQWRQVVEETIGYVLAEMTDPAGGWYSAEDADSPDEHGHGHEGLFSTWTPDEIHAVLDPALGHAATTEALDWWEITAAGNFEGRSIPCRLGHRGELIRPPLIEQARALLYEARSQRRRPGRDDKVLTEWNALFLSSLAEAGAALGRTDWLDAALANGEFLLRELRRPNGRWHRSWQADGSPRARHDALAADHACLVDAFTRLGEATGQARWTHAAVEVADALLDHFWDTEAGGVFTTADDGEALIVRQKDLLDNATPSANSVTAVALYRLAAITGERRFRNHADQTLRLLGRVTSQAPSAAGHALAAVEMQAVGLAEIVITGDRPDLVAEVHGMWLPNAVFAWGEPMVSPLWEGRAEGFAHVCRDFSCELPVTNVDDLRSLLQQSPAK